MKAFFTISFIAVFVVGCGNNSDLPAASSAQDASAAVQSAFANAPEATRRAAAEMANDIAANPVGALGGLEEISKRPELTPEQRDAAAKAMMSAIAELQKAAAGGNDAAQQALEARAARK